MEKQQTEILQPTPALWQTPRWYHAATLAERIATLQPEDMVRSIEERENRERAEKKMQQWKEQYPFDKESYFADRLAQDAITEQELLALLAEPIEAVQARSAFPTPPDWLANLARIFEGYTSTSDILIPLQGMDEKQDAYTLLQPFLPFLQYGKERLLVGVEELVQTYHALPFDPQTIFALLFPNLAQHILPKVKRTLVLELNIARLRGQLQGETPQERFQNYLRLLRQRENLLPFLEEYCILARQILVSTNLWVDASLEFLSHLCSDWDSILNLLTPGQNPGVLVKAAGGAGDTHRRGHSVMLLKFHSGFQLVYKPRSLAIDRHFQDLLAWLNEHGQHPRFRTLQLIDRGTYGWAEYVVASECSSEEGVVRFYERQGGYLALLYALKAVDFHAENIIAAGEDPMLVDLEALFHPDAKVDLSVAKRPATKAVVNSVMQIALLPQRFWSNDQFEGIDMSGLGNAQGQLSPSAVPTWQGVGTDEMKIIRERIELPGSMNCPKLNGQDVQAINYIGSIITGFTSTYRLLCERREEFLRELLPRFALDEIRFIARATRTYATLLEESFHPNMLRDALKRERLFDRLWMAVKQQPYLVRLITAEREDLHRGDIPLFATYPDSRDLFTSEGKRIPEFFDETSLQLVKERIQTLGEEDLQRQVWMIRAAFTSISTPTNDVSGNTPRSRPACSPVNPMRLVSAARTVGDQLYRNALLHEDAADWFGLTWVKEREWRVMPAGLDLHSGLPGIILFLSYLGALTRDVCYVALAKSALKTLHGELEQLKAHLDLAGSSGITICNMLGSCIYLFSHVAALWHESAWLDEAEELVLLLSDHIEKDDVFDIVDGSAGCIASLLSLYTVAPSSQALAAAIRCGDHLLACAQAMEQGVAWRMPRHEMPMPGFAHGTTGIAWSLLQLAAVSGERRFHQTALAALTYERCLLSPMMPGRLNLCGNPPTALKLPDPTTHGKSAMSWSYGVPGIALGRIASLQHIDDAMIREEIEVALQTTITESFEFNHEHSCPNHSLYHGDCGNLETVLLAMCRLDAGKYREHLERLTAQLLSSIGMHGWSMGVPLNVETPGLMMGLSGIGYELLRIAEPERVPSVLLLAPPIV